MSALSVPSSSGAAWAELIFKRLLADVSLWCEVRLESTDVRTWLSADAVAGQGQVHVALRFEIDDGVHAATGAWLIPWPAAAWLAARQRGLSRDEAAELATRERPDGATKRALQEVAEAVAAAVDAIFTERGLVGCSVVSAGCQGLAADHRPLLERRGAELLWVVRSVVRTNADRAWDSVLLVPELAPGGGGGTEAEAAEEQSAA